ncbi:hypothetical protein ACSLPG_28345, partial [Escherichia coli]|uniref:hypothetical protein n=1 Tax=Escherichia coli TaxID=562 RepID=UPI003EE1233E
FKRNIEGCHFFKMSVAGCQFFVQHTLRKESLKNTIDINKKPLGGGFLKIINGRHTKPIVRRILTRFFEKCKNHIAIFGENHLSRHFS